VGDGLAVPLTGLGIEEHRLVLLSLIIPLSGIESHLKRAEPNEINEDLVQASSKLFKFSAEVFMLVSELSLAIIFWTRLLRSFAISAS